MARPRVWIAPLPTLQTAQLRGGGTSQSGQTVNATLVVDCSKHLDHVLELDVAGKRCVVEPGIVLDV